MKVYIVIGGNVSIVYSILGVATNKEKAKKIKQEEKNDNFNWSGWDWVDIVEYEVEE